jgi:hypothetical protein
MRSMQRIIASEIFSSISIPSSGQTLPDSSFVVLDVSSKIPGFVTAASAKMGVPMESSEASSELSLPLSDKDAIEGLRVCMSIGCRRGGSKTQPSSLMMESSNLVPGANSQYLGAALARTKEGTNATASRLRGLDCRMTVDKGAASEMAGGAELEDGPALDGPAAASWVWGMCVVWFVPASDEG